MTGTVEGTTDRDLMARAEELAEQILVAAHHYDTAAERKRRHQVARLLDDPRGKAFLLALTDEVVRIHDPVRAARRLNDLVAEHGVPGFAGRLDQLMLRAGALAAPRLPRVVMPLVVNRLRHEFEGVILPAEPSSFAEHAEQRHVQGIRLNVNVLGEAILGEREAEHRLCAVLERLQRPEIDYVSVKISAICSQLHVLAFDATVERIAKRLRRLYDEALRHTPSKFVNLDMEEYDDLRLTVAVFRKLLDEPAYERLDGGIVLQAYLPDSHAALVELCEWATARHARSGGRIKIRLVKGANLAMESVDAELHGWPQAPYSTKAEVDANYKRMLDGLLDARYADAVRVGVGSHNLFDVGWALARRDAAGAQQRVEIEMLEGMANPQALATKDAAGGLLLYAPVARSDDIESAIAYLIRRLDENTAPDNFLHALFSLKPGSPTWVAERDRFRNAVAARLEPAGPSRRMQNRGTEHPSFSPDDEFANEPDTDWSLPANQQWARAALAQWDADPVTEVAAVVDGETVAGPLDGASVDPARPDETLYRYTLADAALVERAVAAAKRAQPVWQQRGWAERGRILTTVAETIASGRGRTLAVMAHDAGKTFPEGDPEVSEALDFARYYAASAGALERFEGAALAFTPHGTVVVASPWNFPYAIPAGGVLGALAAGNSVILKPAPETVLTASLVAEHCWAGGVPRDVLQFLPCPDSEVGQRLITHPDVDGVILTGAWDTARLFLGWKPTLALHAETSGKNAMVITAAADLDLAVAELVRSAFGHAGQKCSAASLAIVEASVYDHPAFARRLADSVRSLTVGAGWELDTVVGPLIRPPAGPLADALTRLEPGETWLVEPKMVGSNPNQWTPGVKLGVQPGSQFHLTECFGPVLGVMRAKDLDQAIEWQNMPAYGLTGGLQSLDPAEIAHWTEHVAVGNVYVNRHMTGAIVRRQPFGGWKRSVVGPGAKAGGPRYVASLGQWRITSDVDRAALPEQFRRWWHDAMTSAVDPTGLRAERNLFRYRPLRGGVLVRAGDDVSDDDVDVVLLAARTSGVPATVSSPRERPAVDAAITVEDDATLAARLGAVTVDKLRLLGGADDALRLAAHDAGIWLDDIPVQPDARLELYRWVREQAISETRHRHGNVIAPPAAS